MNGVNEWIDRWFIDDKSEVVMEWWMVLINELIDGW